MNFFESLRGLLTTRTLPGTWNGIRQQVDAAQKQHAALATQLTQTILTQLQAFKQEQSKAKLHLENEISRLTKELEKSRSNLSKVGNKMISDHVGQVQILQSIERC